MKLALNLKPETEANAIKRAAELGVTIDKYIEKIILEDLDEKQNLEEIFEPFRENIEGNEISEKHN